MACWRFENKRFVSVKKRLSGWVWVVMDWVDCCTSQIRPLTWWILFTSSGGRPCNQSLAFNWRRRQKTNNATTHAGKSILSKYPSNFYLQIRCFQIQTFLIALILILALQHKVNLSLHSLSECCMMIFVHLYWLSTALLPVPHKQDLEHDWPFVCWGAYEQ